ncbi:MAG: hypothetical protein ABEJ30_02005 [Halorientalis sp.]
MFGFETTSGSVRAVVVVGAVLAEAFALYLAYGLLSTTVGQAVIDALGGD